MDRAVVGWASGALEHAWVMSSGSAERHVDLFRTTTRRTRPRAVSACNELYVFELCARIAYDIFFPLSVLVRLTV